jgi:GT2 family glycosyltransferase
MNKLLTIVIISYKSKKLILSHIQKFYNKFKIIVVENSSDEQFKKTLKKNYKNVNIYLKNNIGYGRAVNFAAKKIKTKYFISMNPDTIINTNTFKSLMNAAVKIKKFGVIGPINKNLKKRYRNKLFIEQKKIEAPVMLFDTQTFKKIKGFDENIFLYYEDNDYFKKCNRLGQKLYLITSSYYNHSKPQKYNKSLNVKSSSFSNIKEKNSSYLVGGWHGQWSKFYYLKKYNGFINALIRCVPSLILNLLQLIIYSLINPAKAKYKYFKIEGFICSLIGLPSFKRSKFDKNRI